MSFVRRDERGQAIVLMTLSLVVIMGMAALVVDVGSWFHTKRRLQGTADAAALAGAQLLPNDPSGAQSQALSLCATRTAETSPARTSPSPRRSCRTTPSASGARRTDPGSSAASSASRALTSTRAPRPGSARRTKARYVAPMVVYCDHPLIHNCNGDSVPTSGADPHGLDKMGAPGAFGMLDLAGSGGNVGSSTLGTLDPERLRPVPAARKYDSDPGAKFSSANMQNALDARIGTVLLFPVFKTLDLQGSNAEYEIIAWIGFHLNSWSQHGNTASLDGYFTEYIAHGILATGGNGGAPSSSFGVKSIQLIE